MKLRMSCFLCPLSDGDPKNYLAYYRRATVFLAMGKSKSALPDLSKVIELKPDFTSVSFCFHIAWFEMIFMGTVGTPLYVIL